MYTMYYSGIVPCYAKIVDAQARQLRKVASSFKKRNSMVRQAGQNMELLVMHAGVNFTNGEEILRKWMRVDDVEEETESHDQSAQGYRIAEMAC